MTYSAYVLTEKSRDFLLSQITPAHSDVIAHHVTYQFPDTNPLPELKEMPYAFAYAKNDLVDCVAVSINSKTERPDGKFFHITLSVNRKNGGKPVHSNDLLINAFEDGNFKYFEPITLELVPMLLK